MKKKVLTCVGTRPNLIKITQFSRWFAQQPHIEHKLLHTGQHFDYNMNDVFFEEQNEVFFEEQNEVFRIESIKKKKRSD